MSTDFVNLVTELHREKYSVQIKNAIVRKVPCGLFYGFSLPKCDDIIQNVIQLKEAGFNLTTLYLLDEEQVNFVNQKITPPLINLKYSL